MENTHRVCWSSNRWTVGDTHTVYIQSKGTDTLRPVKRRSSRLVGVSVMLDEESAMQQG